MSPQEPKTLGAFVRRARKARGLSQAALGRAIGAPASTIMRLERDTIGAPDPAKLQRLAEALDVDVEELMVRHPTVRQGLPGFQTYLRAKTNMSEEAIAEAAAFVADLEKRERRRRGRRP